MKTIYFLTDNKKIILSSTNKKKLHSYYFSLSSDSIPGQWEGELKFTSLDISPGEIANIRLHHFFIKNLFISLNIDYPLSNNHVFCFDKQIQELEKLNKEKGSQKLNSENLKVSQVCDSLIVDCKYLIGDYNHIIEKANNMHEFNKKNMRDKGFSIGF